MSENPWFVETIQSFLFLNCPECHFKTKEKNFFQDHATKKHPRSSVLFEENSYKSELEEHFDHGIEIELEYPILRVWTIFVGGTILSLLVNY